MAKIFVLILSAFLIVQKVEIVPLAQLQNRVVQNNDTLYVVNFWATWCKPCVEEIPYFEEVQRQFERQKVKVMLVSLNSLKELNSVQKFVTQKNIQSETLILQAGNPNIWLNQIDSTWSGAIPATVFYKNGKKVFFTEGELNDYQLDSLISLHKFNRL